MTREEISDRELLHSVGVALELLKQRGVVENDNIVEGLTRHLFQRALGLKMLHRSTKGYHAESKDSTVRYRIKGRCDPAFGHYGTTSLSDFRRLDDKKTRFDYLLTAVYDDYFKVIMAAQIPFDLVYANAGSRRDGSGQSTEAAVFTLTKDVLRHSRVEDLTAALKQVIR